MTGIEVMEMVVALFAFKKLVGFAQGAPLRPRIRACRYVEMDYV